MALEVLEEYRGRASQEPGEEERFPRDEEYRCLHFHTLLEPETMICGECGLQPFK